ncbi:uncharacterized protein UTRI_04655_B [Ustilago trichophora]|uniref:Uncharacterized protein n=1 Tax=Ustilago trichophora TaxID=86804 RepID=A0A5C3EDF6_9BASI|nr:uncharacterized protein UTRI_04655_B [Ustilago trichophora]
MSSSQHFALPVHNGLQSKAVFRCGQRFDPSIVTPDEVDHRFCDGSIFARVLQRRIFVKNLQAELRILRSLPKSSKKTKRCLNFIEYQSQHQAILDIFCLLDYQIMPIPSHPLSQFKLVTSHGKEKLPRPPLQILIPSLRYDISALSEMLRRDLCTLLHPDNILDQSADSLKQRFRIIRAVQNLYAEHCIMLAPNDDAFFFRCCKVCSLYDPEIIRFCRDLHCILLKIFHGQRIKPPSCRYFTPLPEMSDAELYD